MTSPSSFRLDGDLQARLDKEAQREDRSASDLVQTAVAEYLDYKDFFRREMEAAIAEADEGVFISWERVQEWMDSWGTDRELPPPEPDIFPETQK